MVTFSPESLRNIKRFDQLIAYLRDELDWPIETDDFDDLTFDYEPEELGIDPKNAAKIEVIKQLRPLTSDQPWGVFWIKFKPQRLPVVALRRILGQLVIKKRATADRAERPAWELHDLMLISAVGEDDERQITFAHFADESDRTLPTLRVLGWDGADTVLKLDHLNKELHENLMWPEDESDHKAWRTQWSGAFKLRHKEVINTSRELSVRLAELARNIRLRCNSALALETEKGPLRTLMGAFKQALIHDLDEDDFADMYAQTIAYGLLTARVSRHVPGEDAALLPEDFSALVLPTNPFLKELMQTFFHVGGRKWSSKKGRLIGIDFDELGINDVVELLKAANMDDVLRDFGDKNPQEDPVIHFYELFLKEYDAKKRMQRGVFYTPRPVVSFIVRSVDELPRTEFGLADGLADTTTWGEMKARFDSGDFPKTSRAREEAKDATDAKPQSLPDGRGSSEFTIPEGTDPDSPFVVILDPATGTGTFLVEVIDLIYKTMTAKWETDGLMPLEFENLWNDYVPRHLLPRLHGYELMMAPYAIAHMKIGLKLFETGYRFESEERARVYLTNSLEPPQDFSDTFEQMAPALAHEAQAVNDVKRHQGFTVVIGNPPYSNFSANLAPEARAIVSRYKQIDGVPLRERNALQLERNVNDDYIKFIAISESMLSLQPAAILGMITNASYLDARTLRGVRASLRSTFDHIRVLDLGGATNLSGSVVDQVPDENVFESIGQPVGIVIYSRHWCANVPTASFHRERGSLQDKYDWLLGSTATHYDSNCITPSEPLFLFTPVANGDDWTAFVPIDDCLGVYAEGLKTGFDDALVGFTESELRSVLQDLADESIPTLSLRSTYGVGDKGWADGLMNNRDRTARLARDAETVFRFPYRPLDFRWTPWGNGLLKSSSRIAGEDLMVREGNWSLILARQVTGPEQITHFYVSRAVPDNRVFYSKKGSATYFPIGRGAGGSNFTTQFAAAMSKSLGMDWDDNPSGLPQGISFWSAAEFIYGVFHSPEYRARYFGNLAVDFPRVPIPRDSTLFQSVSRLGATLVSLHLMESSLLDKSITTYIGAANSEVEKVGYTAEDQTVWLNNAQTSGFVGVPEQVWNFHIGGYQVCHKWLKDRQAKGGKNPHPGRILTEEDIDHYQKIIVALHETIRIMAEIDEVIEAHGGWPDAFITDPDELEKLKGKSTSGK